MTADECVLWSGYVNPKTGYGTRKVKGVVTYVHREAAGAQPGEVVDHLCHNAAARRGECAGGVTCVHRRCMNPEHLARTTRRGNVESSPLTAASTTCAKGHDKQGQPRCRECQREGQRRRRQEVRHHR